MRACAHCGAPIPDARRGSPRRFCSPRCRQAGYRRRQERVREDLSDLEPGAARQLRDRQIAAAWDKSTSEAGKWTALYGEMLQLGGAALRELDGLMTVEAALDQSLIASERRRLRNRFRFWGETMRRGSLPAVRA